MCILHLFATLDNAVSTAYIVDWLFVSPIASLLKSIAFVPESGVGGSTKVRCDFILFYVVSGWPPCLPISRLFWLLVTFSCQYNSAAVPCPFSSQYRFFTYTFIHSTRYSDIFVASSILQPKCSKMNWVYKIISERINQIYFQ